MAWLWVALGGATGAVLRFKVGALVGRNLGVAFPYGTLSVNLLGSFVIGLLWVIFNQQAWANPALKQLFIVGVLGGFTTFSSFSLDSILLLQQERYMAAFSYVSVSLLGCLAATALGIWAAKSFI